MTHELPTVIDRQVARLCHEGREHVGSCRFDAAVLSYKAAFDLLPAPKEHWRFTKEILSSITDACFLKGDYQNAQEAISAVLQCPNADQDPEVHLRFGKVLFELGQLQQASQALSRAYRTGGARLFRHEDPKYAQLVQENG